MSDGFANWLPRATAQFVICTLIATALAAVWTIDYLPTHDGPQHIYTVHAANLLDDPGAGYDRYLTAGHPITAHGFAVLFAPFDRWLPWQTAYRIALSLMVVLWTLGCVALARSLGPGRVWQGIALAGAGFQWSLYMGMFSFYIASAFGLWVLAYGASHKDWKARQRGLMGGLLLVQALFHVVPALFTATVVGAMIVWRAPGRERVREALLFLAAASPTALVAMTLVAVSAELPQLHARTASDWHYQWPGLWILGKCFNGGPAWRAWPLTLLAAISPVVAALGLRSRVREQDKVLFLAGAVGLACALAMPLHLPGWDFLSPRFLPIAVTCLILAFPLEALPRSGRGTLAALLALFALACNAWAIGYNRDLDRKSREALSGLVAPIEREGARLAIVMDPYLGRPLQDRSAPIPFAVPLLNLGQLYATEQGGLAADTFAVSSAIHHVLIRKDGAPYPAYPDRSYAIVLAREENRDDSELRRKITSHVASFGTAFEDVILFGSHEDADLLIRRGYEPDFRKDGLMIARFRGCDLSLELTQSSKPHDADSSILVEMGWFPLLEVSEHLVIAPGAPRRVPLRGAPCGPIWLRVTAAPSPKADVARAPRTCRGADAAGRLILADSRETPIVRCDLETR